MPNYWDWFDNGPGSESYKRRILKEENERLKSKEYNDFFWKMLEERYPRLKEKNKEKYLLSDELFEI